MVLERTWNKWDQRLTVSYIDKNGKRQLWQKFLHHIPSYEYCSDDEIVDNNKIFNTWNHKKCSKVFKDSSKYKPNEFDILEILYKLNDHEETRDLYKDLTTIHPIKLYTYDIEVEVTSDFPDATISPNKVTSIALVGPDLSCMVMGLHKLDSPQVELMKERYFKWIQANDFARNLMISQKYKPKFFYQSFVTEKDLLEHWFLKILPNIALISGWNNYRFDKQYLVNRIKRVFGEKEAMNMIKKASPIYEVHKLEWAEMDGSRGFTYGATHQVELDYLELVKKYDLGTAYESYSLDWVGSNAIKAHKIKYEGTIQQLYENDPEWYYYYNAVDALIVQLIHQKLRCIDVVNSFSSITLMPMLKSMGQVGLTTAGVFKLIYDEGKRVVYDWDEVSRVKIPYEGAFCGCVPGRFEYTVCDDFKSLYPSQVITCNLSFENIVKNYSEPDSCGRIIELPWDKDQLEEFKKNPDYFVTVMGNVYDNRQDSLFRKYQRANIQRRDQFKYLGWNIDAELINVLDHKIEEMEKLEKQSA